MEDKVNNSMDQQKFWKKFEKMSTKKLKRILESEILDEKEIPFIIDEPNLTKKKKNCLRYVCISDTHGMHRNILGGIPYGDVLIHAGDFTNFCGIDELNDFFDWFKSQPHPVKIVVAGNHDFIFDELNYVLRMRKNAYSIKEYQKNLKQKVKRFAAYLSGDGITYKSQRIYGLMFPNRYTKTAQYWYPGTQLKNQWKMVEKNIDVLVTHGPPFCRCDTDPSKHHGSRDLYEGVKKYIKPRVHVFGHAHGGHGSCFDGETLFINCSIVDDKYNAIYKPIVFDLPTDPRRDERKGGGGGMM